MVETNVPAVEAEAVADRDDEVMSYELAFHVLPTVAEGEVATIFGAIKDQITKLGGAITDEEAPERFELAYEVVRHLEGKNRKFQSAYFGWVRFSATTDAIAPLTQAVESNTNLLRHLLIRLSKVEEENPFRIHEAMKDQKMVTTVEESEVVPDFTSVDKEEKPAAETEEKKEESAEVDDEELEKALEQKTV